MSINLYEDKKKLTVVAKRIREQREKRGWSQVYVAKQLKHKRSQNYANYENGFRMPDANTIGQIADLYETTIDYLLGKTDNPKRAIDFEALYQAFDLTDREILEKYIFTIDNKPLTTEEAKSLIAFARIQRSTKL